MSLSVLMSVYYGETPEYLEACLQSLADQTLKADEVVLVEDGPISIELKHVIDFYRDILNIVSVLLPENLGLAEALNAGLAVCKHELIARMDSDDICLPQRFEKQVKIFGEKKNLHILGTWAVEIDRDGNRSLVRKKPVTNEQIRDSVWTCPMIHPTVTFRKKFICEIGGYDVSMRRRQDYKLWFTCCLNGANFANIPEPLLLYRFDSVTHQKQSMSKAWRQSVMSFEGSTMLNLPWWKKLGCFVPFFISILPTQLHHLAYITSRSIYHGLVKHKHY